MNCPICHDTGLDERDPDYIAACDCRAGELAAEYLFSPSFGFNQGA